MKEIKLGYLNIPKLKIEPFSTRYDIQTRLYIQYSELLEKSDIGKDVLDKLQKDKRVQKLNGKMISRGYHASIFETATLAMWYLWAINEFGERDAEKCLNEFLDASEITVMNTLWVLGIEVEKPIKLIDNLVLMPVDDMPDSREKEYFLEHELETVGRRLPPKPKAAIVTDVKVTKSFEADEIPRASSGRDKNLHESSKLLHDTALVLNTIQNISCITYLSTTYTLPTMPMGLFAGSGGSMSHYDVIGRKLSKVKPEQSSEVNTVISHFIKLPGSEKERFTRILLRLSQSKRKQQLEDKILDLVIALEMALLSGKNENQLKLSFRLRGSLLVASNVSERQVIYKLLGDIYDYRSQIAHSGVLFKKNDKSDMEKVKFVVDETTRIAERIIRKLICDDVPDWDKVLLGIKE